MAPSGSFLVLLHSAFFLLPSLSGGPWSVVRGPSPGFVGALWEIGKRDIQGMYRGIPKGSTGSQHRSNPRATRFPLACRWLWLALPGPSQSKCRPSQWRLLGWMWPAKKSRKRLVVPAKRSKPPCMGTDASAESRRHRLPTRRPRCAVHRRQKLPAKWVAGQQIVRCFFLCKSLI